METTKKRINKNVNLTKTLDFGDFTNTVLIKLISFRKEKSLKDLKGKISFRSDYDYKSLRNGV